MKQQTNNKKGAVEEEEAAIIPLLLQEKQPLLLPHLHLRRGDVPRTLRLQWFPMPTAVSVATAATKRLQQHQPQQCTMGTITTWRPRPQGATRGEPTSSWCSSLSFLLPLPLPLPLLLPFKPLPLPFTLPLPASSCGRILGRGPMLPTVSSSAQRKPSFLTEIRASTQTCTDSLAACRRTS